MKMMGNAQPHFAPPIEAIGDGMFYVERTLMRSAKLRQILQHDVRVNAVPQEHALIRERSGSQPFLRLNE